MNLLKGCTPALRLIVLLAACVGALTSCERRGTIQPVKEVAPDPRVLKHFGESGSRFCAFELIYSEATDSESAQTKKTLIVATGESLSVTTTALAQSCAGLGIAGKMLCSGRLKDSDSYLCVHDSMFITRSARNGEWECQMIYSVPTEAVTAATSGAERSAIAADARKILTVTGKPGDTVQQVIHQAFAQCAEIKGEQTVAVRNACARAMIDRKMLCKDISKPAPVPSPNPRVPRVFH